MARENRFTSGILPLEVVNCVLRRKTVLPAEALHRPLLSEKTGTTVKLPSYDQVRREVHRPASEPELVTVREGAKVPLVPASLPNPLRSPFPLPHCSHKSMSTPLNCMS